MSEKDATYSFNESEIYVQRLRIERPHEKRVPLYFLLLFLYGCVARGSLLILLNIFFMEIRSERNIVELVSSNTTNRNREACQLTLWLRCSKRNCRWREKSLGLWERLSRIGVSSWNPENRDSIFQFSSELKGNVGKRDEGKPFSSVVRHNNPCYTIYTGTMYTFFIIPSPLMEILCLR